MAVTPFVRSPNISSSLVLQRIEVKRQIYAKRRSVIKRESEKLSAKLEALGADNRADLESRLRSLEAEDRAIAGFEADLEEVARTERAAVDQRAGRRSLASSDGSDMRSPTASPSESVTLAAAGGSAVARYDPSLCLFKSSSAAIVGDRSAKPIGHGYDGDVLLARLINLIDAPGLAHMALLIERRQEVLDLFSDDLLPAAIGLPAAEAFAVHLFSADAYSTFLDADASDGFLEDLIGPRPKPAT